MPESRPASTTPVTDSPWYWVLIFALAALVGVLTIGPKFERRQEAIEAKFHGRQRAQKREALEPPTTSATAPDQAASQVERPWNRIFTLGPLVVVIIVIALVAFTRVIKLQRSRLADLRPQATTVPPEPP